MALQKDRLLSNKRVIVGLCLIAGLAVLGWLMVSKEPSYQGKTLKEWQRELVSEVQSPAAQVDYWHAVRMIPPKYSPAFRAMKKKAMPILLRQFKAKDGDVQDRIADFLARRELPRIGFYSRTYRQEAASLSFFAIGKEDEELVAKLLEMAQSSDQLDRYQAWRVLAHMSFDSENYLQVLVSAMRSGTLEDRSEALFCLMILGDKGRPILPVLLQMELHEFASGKKDAQLRRSIEAISK